MRCSDASLTGGATLYYLFELFHNLQQTLVLNAHNATNYDVNVPDVARRLISKWRWKYEKQRNVLDSQVFLLEIRVALRRRAHAG